MQDIQFGGNLILYLESNFNFLSHIHTLYLICLNFTFSIWSGYNSFQRHLCFLTFFSFKVFVLASLSKASTLYNLCFVHSTLQNAGYSIWRKSDTLFIIEFQFPILYWLWHFVSYLFELHFLHLKWIYFFSRVIKFILCKHSCLYQLVGLVTNFCFLLHCFITLFTPQA